jgi:hypothetical protein
MQREILNIIMKIVLEFNLFSLNSVYLRLCVRGSSHCSSAANVHLPSEIDRYCMVVTLAYPSILPICCSSREVVIYLPGVYYSKVVRLCKQVSQALSNSSFSAFTIDVDGRGERGNHYQNPLPLHRLCY